MKTKNLIILLLVLVVLVGIAVGRSMMKPARTIEQAVELPSLLPEGLAKTDIAAITVFLGSKPDESVTLTQDADNPDKWRVSTHFNAPAKLDKVEEFLDKLVGLQGEFRAAIDTDEGLDEFQLTDASAFHVQGMKKGADEPAFEILVGKAPAPNQVFARAARSNDVFVVPENLRRDAGLWTDDSDKAPEADTWLDKTILSIDKEKLAALDITTPEKHLVFENREKPSEAPEPVPEEEGADPVEPEPPTVEHEWVLAEGGPGIAYKQSGFSSMLNAFPSLSATGIVDPAKRAEWGLDQPAFRLAISVSDQDEPVVIEGGRLDPSGDGYVQVAGAADDVVYQLSKWQFERIFPKGADLFDLPKLDVDKKSIQRVVLDQPEGAIELVRVEDEWTVAAPAADLEVQKNTLDTIANTLAAWKPGDYADDPTAAQLDTPTRTATFSTGDGESHTIVLGADSKGIDGAYARLDDSETALVMSRSDMDRVFVSAGELYQHDVLDIDELDVVGITVTREEDGFELAKGEGGWTLTAGDTAAEADEDAVDDLTAAIADFQISDIRLGQSKMAGEPYATLTCAMEDGTTHTLTIGAVEGDVYPITVDGKGILFEADTLDVHELLPASDTLRKPEPEPEPAPESTEEAVGATDAAADAAAPVIAISANDVASEEETVEPIAAE